MATQLFLQAKHALRGLLRDRAFTAVAVLSIGLGVGANSAIFSLVDQALLQQLPVKNPEQLVMLDWKTGFIGVGWGSDNLIPHPMFRQLSAENQVFDGLIARHPTSVLLTTQSTPEPANAEFVSGSYFPVLGVAPALGRLLDPSDDEHKGAHPVAVVSFDYWKRHLNGAADVLGRKVLVNNVPLTIVGVAQEGFQGIDRGEVSALWMPIMMSPAAGEFDWLDNHRGRWLHVFGRLKPGVTAEQARAGIQPWFKTMLEEDTHRESWPKVTPQQRQNYLSSVLEVRRAAQGRSDLRARIEKPLFILLAATGLILLLACLNVANLCLARAFSHRREIALRLALGASRGRIMRDLLIENTLLAIGGTILGVLLAPVVSQLLISFLPGTVGYTADVNPRVFLFALGAALFTSFLFGLAPALQSSRAHPIDALKQGALTLAGGVGVRKLLVVGQIALAMVLLIGAGLFVRTLANLRSQGPGFQTAKLITFRFDPGRGGQDITRAHQTILKLVSALHALPEIKDAGISVSGMLTGGSWNTPLTVGPGGQRTATGVVHLNAVGPTFFTALGTPILAGRNFDDRDVDMRKDAKFRSAIVSESFARRYFGARSPLGERLGIGAKQDTKLDIEIVGVVKTFSRRSLRELDDQVFFPFDESEFRSAAFWVRAQADPVAAIASIRAAAQQVDSAIPLTDMSTLDDFIDSRTLLNERLLASLATAFAGLAVLLAVVGLYGVISFVVTRRTREIGIRLALGAPRGAAVGLIVRDAAIMVAGGLAIALPSVWLLGRLIRTQLFGVQPMDAGTIAAACLLVTAVALGASALPARRATTVTAMEALRHE